VRAGLTSHAEGAYVFLHDRVHEAAYALETELPAHVPAILADRIELQQVILNLMMNAVEAMSGVRSGPRELMVRSGTDGSEHVVVSVEDSGPGLDAENLYRLFDAFYTTKAHGLGMGLAISRSIIDAHGGRLWATAKTPRGAGCLSVCIANRRCECQLPPRRAIGSPATAFVTIERSAFLAGADRPPAARRSVILELRLWPAAQG
jgi:C4-dicarboxylate-specific signal transduction histidine kinase